MKSTHYLFIRNDELETVFEKSGTFEELRKIVIENVETNSFDGTRACIVPLTNGQRYTLAKPTPKKAKKAKKGE